MNRHTATLLFVVVAVVAGSVLAAPVAAQQADGLDEDENEIDDEVQTIDHQLGNADILSIEWDDRTAHITIEARSNAHVGITDAGAIDNLGSGGSSEIGFESYRIGAGETREITFTVASDPVITVQEGGEMIAATGDRQVLDVITGAPTVALVQWAGASGIGGTLLATGLSVGILKRRHHNSYRELTNDERHRIERDPVDGVLGRVRRFLVDHYVALTIAALSGVYALFVAFGVVRGPVEYWNDLADTHRVIFAGTAVTTLVALPPAFALVSRIWDPDVEFVLDVDADDIIQSNRGIEAEGGGFAVYSGPPERVREMSIRNADTDAGKSKSESPGGRAVVVRNMDPTENEADGTWPGQASDEELVAKQAKIRDNRQQLKQAAELGKNLLRQVSSISISSEIAATRGIDAALRDVATVDSDPLDAILNEAAEGTDWEDYFNPDEPEDEDRDADHGDDRDDEEDDQTEDTNEEQT